MNEVIAYISNPFCFNKPCSNNVRFALNELNQKNINVNHSNSVWKPELRVRYIPKDLKELYEKDRTTFHFLFDQVCCVASQQVRYSPGTKTRKNGIIFRK